MVAAALPVFVTVADLTVESLPGAMLPKSSDAGVMLITAMAAFTVKFTGAVPAVPPGVGVAVSVPE